MRPSYTPPYTLDRKQKANIITPGQSVGCFGKGVMNERAGEYCSCGSWYGDARWNWKRMSRLFEEMGDSFEKRNYLMRGECPSCGVVTELFQHYSVLEVIRNRKKEEAKVQRTDARKAEHREERAEMLSSLVECLLCHGEIGRVRKGWSTCSEKCGQVWKKSREGKNQGIRYAVVKSEGKWEVWLWEWEWEDWELIERCSSRKEAYDVLDQQ